MTSGLLMDLVLEQSRATQVVVARHPAFRVDPQEVERLVSVTLQMYETMKGYWNWWLQNVLSRGIEAGSARENLTYPIHTFEAWLNLVSSVQTLAEAVASRTGHAIPGLDELQVAIPKVVEAKDSARHAMELASRPPPEVDPRILEEAILDYQQGKFRRITRRGNSDGV